MSFRSLLDQSFILNASNNPKLLLAFSCLLATLFISRFYNSPWRKLPPGPRGIPILGNILQLQDKQWLTFTELRKTYGDLVYLNVAGQPLIVVNSHKIAADLLDRRAALYSDRPNNIVASDILTGGLLIALSHYTDTWRRLRKAAHEGFHKGVVHRYQPTQFKEAVLLTSGVLSDPDSWEAHLRRTAASSIMSVVYATPPILSEQEPSIKSINDFVARVTRAALPGAHLVEFFPWMVHIPAKLAKWKHDAQESFIKDSVMFEGLFKGVQRRMTQGEDKPSLSATLIQEADRHKLSDQENAWLAGTMYAAGAETTSGIMVWLMLAMLIYPETQRRAQAELDAVVGRDRLPSFTDYEKLPYVRAMVKEALRWRPVAPVGVPHRSTEDDWYEGNFIPAGSIIIANVWYLNHDPRVYGADAHHFNPARHLDGNGQLLPGPVDTKDEGHVTYGFGRRICVGRHIANNSLFINIAAMLWAMNIGRPEDENGQPIPLDVDGCVHNGVVV
ncbi:cytochrome P450 [Neolentinus lepideus HHB14362 ss-1]|uniref:Cytochrome P450 n=1 Tax=Neolentinus lepideus HHB14362 ss-1 TaxID=1314782 RepID=A0A165V2B8_9AGAM|nr:cytochrome P450 [Neolentinus lepideus HHB14362 ss-1]